MTESVFVTSELYISDTPILNLRLVMFKTCDSTGVIKTLNLLYGNHYQDDMFQNLTELFVEIKEGRVAKIIEKKFKQPSQDKSVEKALNRSYFLLPSSESFGNPLRSMLTLNHSVPKALLKVTNRETWKISK